MSYKEEFDFWCAEYRDRPDMAESESERLLQVMCKEGNPYALQFVRVRDLNSSDRDLVDEVTEPLRGLQSDFTERSLDDLDGNEWGARIGAIDQGAVFTPPAPDQYDAVDYPENWRDIARSIKIRRGWRCEICKFEKPSSGLIQVHHINGDKGDSSPANLQVLCAACHGAKHGRAPAWPSNVTDAEMTELNRHQDRVRAGRRR